MISLTLQTQINNQFALKVNHFFASRINFLFFHLAILSLVLNPIFLHFTSKADSDLQFANFQSGKISNIFSNIIFANNVSKNIADFSFVNKQEFLADQEIKIQNEKITKENQEQLATNQQVAKKDRRSIQNASSLFFASLEDDSRQPLRRFAPEGVFAEKRNAFFLTQKPDKENDYSTSLNS